MKLSKFTLVPGLLLACLVSSPGTAKEPDPTVDSVLAKWEEASQKIKTLDAKLTIRTYDPIFSSAPMSVEKGRFYYEAPDFARYEIDEPRDKHCDHAYDALVWTGEGLFMIDHRQKTCWAWSSQTIQRVRKEYPQMPERSLWECYCKGWAFLETIPAMRLASPQDIMPLFLNTSTQAEKKRFNFEIETRDGRVVVKATPKQKHGALREVEVMLDAESYRLVAHQVVYNFGQKAVHIFDAVKINSKPPDRDALRKPVPPGYEVLRPDVMLFGPPACPARRSGG